MKNKNQNRFSDEIRGKETEDYICEFSPHRLSVICFEEDSEAIFDADEEKAVLPRSMLPRLRIASDRVASDSTVQVISMEKIQIPFPIRRKKLPWFTPLPIPCRA